MIELTDDQKKAVAAAQTRFSNLKENADNLNKDQIDLLFGEARSMNGWHCLLYTSPSPRDQA